MRPRNPVRSWRSLRIAIREPGTDPWPTSRALARSPRPLAPPRLEPFDGVRDPLRPGVGPSRVVDPGDVGAPIERRERLEESSCRRLVCECGTEVRCQPAELGAFGLDNHHGLGARTNTRVAAPGRSQLQRVVIVTGGEHAPERATVDRTGDVVAILVAPRLVRIKRQADLDAA